MTSGLKRVISFTKMCSFSGVLVTTESCWDEVVNSMSLSLCSCYVCVIVIHHKLADVQFFMADAQFFRADVQFFAAGLL